MPSMFDKDSMIKRFHELGAKREAIKAASNPLRAKRDAYAAESDATLRAMDDQIREAERGLFEIEQERAIIARALGGKTGSA